jgi:hypothetical protein
MVPKPLLRALCPAAEGQAHICKGQQFVAFLPYVFPRKAPFLCFIKKKKYIKTTTIKDFSWDNSLSSRFSFAHCVLSNI